jgi:SAM-dependent methyltransferase
VYQLVSERYGGSTKRALDYGCGSGYGANLLAAHFGSVTAIDIDGDTIHDCAARFPAPNLTFSVFAPPAQPFPDSSFDCVFSFQVVEHIPLDDVNGYIRSIWAMVKPGGVAIVTTPNQGNYVGGHSGNPHHIKEYSANELAEAIGEAIPNATYRIFGQKDVPSTQIRIKIRRAYRNRPAAVWMARIVTIPLRLLEVAGIISTDVEGMLVADDIETVVGGFYVELSKPMAAVP